MARERVGAWLILAGALAACGGGGGSTPPPVDPCAGGACATGTVGPAGGAIRAATGAAVVVPAGALDDTTAVGITTSARAPPAGAGAVGPLFQLTPDGAVFASPVTVTLPLPAGVTAASIYWQRPDRSGYDAIGGRLDLARHTISVEVAHFSGAFVGQAAATRLVAGTAVTTWISASSRVSEPTPGFDAPEALVPDGAGGFTHLPGAVGSGPGAGTFTIAGVPTGEYLLRIGSRWLVTDSSAPDLSSRHGGRPPSRLTPLARSTPLDLDLSNLAPWQPGDELEVFGTETNHWDFASDRLAAPALGGGETSATLAMDLRSFNCGETPYLLRGSAGHRLYAAQLVSATSAGGVPYRALARLVQLAPFDAADGETSVVTGVMGDVARANSISLDVRFSAFRAAFDTDGGPDSAPFFQGDGGTVGVLAQPGQTSDGFYSCNADLLLLEDASGADVTATGLTFGSPADMPLAGSWGIIGLVRWSERTTLQLSGSNAPIRAGGVIEWATTLEALQAGPLTPPLTQPRFATVAGVPFFQGGVGMGLMPTLAWSPPLTGVADAYDVSVTEVGLDASGGSVALAVPGLSFLTTPHPAVTIPPGVLEAGRAYYFRITATGRQGASVGLDRARASIVSGIFLP